MLPNLDRGNKRLGRQKESLRVNFGLLIATKLLSPRPLDVAGRADEVEAVCRHEALQPVKAGGTPRPLSRQWLQSRIRYEAVLFGMLGHLAGIASNLVWNEQISQPGSPVDDLDHLGPAPRSR